MDQNQPCLARSLAIVVLVATSRMMIYCIGVSLGHNWEHNSSRMPQVQGRGTVRLLCCKVVSLSEVVSVICRWRSIPTETCCQQHTAQQRQRPTLQYPCFVSFQVPYLQKTVSWDPLSCLVLQPHFPSHGSRVSRKLALRAEAAVTWSEKVHGVRTLH